MRRIETRFRIIFCVLIALNVSISSQPKDLFVSSLDNQVTVNFSVNAIESNKIIRALDKGQTISVSYNLKTFQRSEGLASYFGDILIDEKTLNYLIKFDIFQKEYLLKKYNGKIESYPDINLLLKELFSLSNYQIYFPIDFQIKNCYMLAQVKVNTLKLLPPLNVLSFILPGLRFESKIYKSEIIEEEM